MTEVLRWRTDLVTDFHRRLVTPDWLAQLSASLTGLQGREIEGRLRALHTDPANLGPQSAIKYRFEADLQASLPEDCPMALRYWTTFDYLPISQTFKFRGWKTHYTWKPGADRRADALLRYGLISRDPIDPLPTPTHNNRLLAFERDLLPLGGARFALRDPDAMAQTVAAHGPARFLLLDKQEFRSLRFRLFGTPEQEEHRVHVFSCPTQGPVPAWQDRVTADYRLSWKGDDRSVAIGVWPDQMLIHFGFRPYVVPLTQEQRQRLAADHRRAILQPALERPGVQGDSWYLTDASGAEVSVFAPLWGPFLQFALAHLQLAGFGFIVRRVAPPELHDEPHFLYRYEGH